MCVFGMCFYQVLDMRIPFLLSSIKDFQQHVPNGQDSMVCLHPFPIQYFSQSESISCVITYCEIPTVYILTVCSDFVISHRSARCTFTNHDLYLHLHRS